ncbi:hypothetical protein [Novipirellula sp.]
MSRKTESQIHAPEWRWPAVSEVKVNCRHPVMAVVLATTIRSLLDSQ